MIRKPFWVVVFVLMCSSIFIASDTGFAQQQPVSKPAANPLVRLLQDKGILTEEEAVQIGRASSSADAEKQLAKLLVRKGIITQADYEHTYGVATMVSASTTTAANAVVLPAVYRLPTSGEEGIAAAARPAPVSAAPPLGLPAPSDAPAVIPAITPIRVFPVGGLTKGEMKPAISMGNLHVTPYGFIKATFIHDSSSPGGDDFPLPGFLTDTGPQGGPEFHVKARSSRFGANFEWLDPSPNLTITGKVEADFEGNFTRSDNRNLSSIRSSVPSIRLAYVRLDYKLGEKDTFSTLLGQDWTPFSSSTLPNLLETTILAGGYGTLWERDPQIRFGWTHDFESFKLMPEVAAVLPASGNVPGPNNLANQLGYGERQGPDSARP
ncbi:MAG TPA: hypothetical protein VNB49_01360, partial [Candidatus Dormibacteraeota bacterium]|nr:hypothetical protein [Candidatus Dormibacteraeota bacterium]